MHNFIYLLISSLHIYKHYHSTISNITHNIEKHIHNVTSWTNGVKQGGVLSTLLFSVYLNDLLCQLRDQNIGCHMNSLFVGAVIMLVT